jgi:hypothetical protein
MIDGTASDIAAWGSLGVGTGASVALAIFWMKIGGRLAKADAAERMAGHALAATELVKAQIADARIEYAKELANYVTDKDLAAAENRLAGLVENMRGDLRVLGDRINRFMDGHGRS